MWLTGGTVARTRSVQRLQIIRKTITLAHLPTELQGLRIVHLSDLHIGPILQVKDLPRIVAAVQKLEPHLIAVTGDFVDLSLSVLDDIIASFHQWQAPLGVWLVPGNHDYLDDGPQLIQRLRAAGLNLLLNESVRLAHQGRSIVISGIDYAPSDALLAKLVHHALRRPAAHGQADLRLLLSHHPHAFEPACKHRVHLTLAGHTHGGQLVLARSKRSKRGSLGLGSLAFRYPHGLYQQGDHYLYVTAGVGSWFPLRLRCPAEIALLTLQRSL